MDEITGATATVALDSLAEVGNVLSIGGLKISRGKLDKSYLGTVDVKEYRADDLQELGEITFKCQFDSKADLPTQYDDDEITITFPLQEAGNTPATLVVSGFFGEVGTPEAQIGKICEVEFKFIPDGETFTWTPEVTPAP